jgi:hypothetical protein
MTCIVAVEAGSSVWLGSDSFIGGHMSSAVLDRPKWGRVGSATIAYCGGLRGLQLLSEMKFRRIRRGEDEQAYLVALSKKAFVAFVEWGANIDGRGSGADTHEQTFLAAVNGKAFTIQNDYSVYRTADGFAAAGAGEDYALGALLGLATEPPADRVRRALEISGQLSPLVRGPYHVVEVK